MANVETLDVDQLLETARASSSGRATQVFRAEPYEGKGILSQVVLALANGNALSKHGNPGEALLMVLRGRVTLSTDSENWELGEWEQVSIPQELHELTALEDSVVVLTMAKISRPEHVGMPGIH
ncbi:MAG: LuxR family transcriptional regulator [Candidatus Nanopelagicales bacterium]